MAIEEWMSMFPEVSIQHLLHSFSDHCPLLIITKREDNWLTGRKFKFEVWWVLEESFTAEVKHIWER